MKERFGSLDQLDAPARMKPNSNIVEQKQVHFVI